MSVLEQLTQREADSMAAAMERYREIVIALADNDDPELEAVQEVLQQTGKTAQQLAKDVGELQSLGGTINELVNAAVHENDLAAANKKLDTAEAEMQSLISQHQQKMLPLKVQIQKLEQSRQVAVSVKSRFIDSYCKNHHRNSSDTNDRNGRYISQVETLVARLGKLEFEIKQSGGGKKLLDEKAAATAELNQLKAEILRHAKNLHSGY